jgi:hypothetical protein
MSMIEDGVAPLGGVNDSGHKCAHAWTHATPFKLL